MRAIRKTRGLPPACCTRAIGCWQMELYRRVTMGRLSEVLGETTIPFDSGF